MRVNIQFIRGFSVPPAPIRDLYDCFLGAEVNAFYKDKRYTDVVNYCNNRYFKASLAGNGMPLAIAKKYFNSLLRSQEKHLVDDRLKGLLPQNDEQYNQQLVASVFQNNFTTIPLDKSLTNWCLWNYRIQHHLLFNNYFAYSKALKPLFYYFRHLFESNYNSLQIMDIFQKSFRELKPILSDLQFNEFLTTLLYTSNYCRRYELTTLLWEYKIKKKIELTSNDLASIMKAQADLGNYETVLKLYDEYPNIHNDYSQFDQLLIAHSRLKDWNKLRDQFESLYGIGNLPNLDQYGIVMYAVASEGDSKAVDKLHVQLLRRGLIPNYSILQSILYSHYKASDYHTCLKQFELFDEYKIAPSPSTISIMLNVYGRLVGIDSALKFFKKTINSNPEIISEVHFAILINHCSHTTNSLIAKEIFNIMTENYDIIPSEKSIAALMHTYNECNLPQQALHIYKQYYLRQDINKSLINEDNIIKIYNEALIANLKIGDEKSFDKLYQQIIDQHTTLNSEFYRIIMLFHIQQKKDIKHAEGILSQMLANKNESLKYVTVKHFEVLMGGYDRMKYHKDVLRNYSKMSKLKIPLNSKILYYIIKSTFGIQIALKKELTPGIKLVEDILKSVQKKQLNIASEDLHPSIVALPIKLIIKYDNPSKAFKILNHYNRVKYKKNDHSSHNKMVLMRSQLMLHASLENWDAFNKTFKELWKQILFYKSQPSAIIENRKMRGILMDVFFYKVHQLVVTNNIVKIPEWLEKLKKNNLYIDNISWNEVIRVMFHNSKTLEEGLKIVDEKLIHGYNLIHKLRYLKKSEKIQIDSMNKKSKKKAKTKPWLLTVKSEDNSKYIPKLYLKSDIYTEIMECMDTYLNHQVKNLDKTVIELFNKYPYFMKSYLMKPRDNVYNWVKIEKKYPRLFKGLRNKTCKLRELKKIVDSNGMTKPKKKKKKGLEIQA